MGPFLFVKGKIVTDDSDFVPAANPAVVIYHKPTDAKLPRAAWFDLTVKASATLHAERQGYTWVNVPPPQIDLVKSAVPEGEVATNGKITLPAIKRDVLERLLANMAGEPVDAPDGSGKLPGGAMPTYIGCSDRIPASQVPFDPLWANLTVNMVVLVAELTDQGTPEGWWEAVITAIHGDVFTLHFRDYPRQGVIRRKRDQIAIMYPPPVRV